MPVRFRLRAPPTAAKSAAISRAVQRTAAARSEGECRSVAQSVAFWLHFGRLARARI